MACRKITNIVLPSLEKTNPESAAISRIDAFSIVIPVYNEAESISALIEEIAVHLKPPPDYEVIVVDDGSTDTTAARLVEMRARGLVNLRILRHQTRVGQSAALRTGVEAARNGWIATLDGDRQNPPADIQRLISALTAPENAQVQLVCGHRRRRMDNWLRRTSSRIANTVRSRLLNDHIQDTGCSLKLFRREVFLRLPWFDHMHRFLPALMQREGASVIAVDVDHRPRLRGESKYGMHNRLWTGIVDLLGVMWLSRRSKTVLSDEVE